MKLLRCTYRPVTIFCRLARPLVCLACIAIAHPGFGHGDLHLQIEQVTAEIAGQPENAELYLRRGELHRAHGDPRSAVADYDRVTALNPQLAAVDLARARLLLASGAYRAAIEAINRFLGSEPNRSDALITRARARHQLRDFLEAAADFTAAINHAPRPEPEYYLERAHALTAAGPEHGGAALAGLKEGLVRLANPITLVLAALDLEIAHGRYDDALGRIDRAMASLPRKAPWIERRGDILAKAGREGDARRAFAEALAEIEQMPAQRRSTAANLALEQRLREKVRARAAYAAQDAAPRTEP